MRQVVKGDEKAFKLLASMYKKPLCSFCGTFMNGHNDYVEDVVQQVLIIWWQKAPRWSPLKGKLKSWVFTIASNKCKDYLKRQNLHNEELTENSAVIHSLVDGNLHTLHQNKAILNAMEKLSSKQKEIIWLFYFENLKQTEVADKLNISLKAVESSLSRSRLKLKLILEKDKKELL